MDEPVYERYIDACELRMDGAQAVITGHAMRYGEIAKIGRFQEQFMPGALEYDDVILDIQHQTDRPIARTGGDGGLVLEERGDLLTVEARPPDTQDARDAITKIKARILRGFSIKFLCLQDHFIGNLRQIHKAKLTAIGLVDRPAYKDALIQLEARAKQYEGIRKNGKTYSLRMWDWR